MQKAKQGRAGKSPKGKKDRPRSRGAKGDSYKGNEARSIKSDGRAGFKRRQKPARKRKEGDGVVACACRGANRQPLVMGKDSLTGPQRVIGYRKRRTTERVKPPGGER